MRVRGLAIATAFAFGVSSAAFAQNPPRHPVMTAPDVYGATQDHWIAGAFVGGNFGGNAVESTSATFGGEVGYLWHGAVGVEALGDYAHNFKLGNVLLADDPHVLTYMANAIVAVPLGSEGEFRPYFSGGFGGISMKTDVFGVAADTGAIVTNTAHQTRFGTNIGGGFMGFAGKVGVRGDVRWYKASTDTNLSGATPADVFTETLVSGLEFWRANGGVVFRW